MTQIDLPLKTVSGLVQIQDVLGKIEGIHFCYFDRNDVVRHKLVKDKRRRVDGLRVTHERLARELRALDETSSAWRAPLAVVDGQVAAAGRVWRRRRRR
jgi:hypothetical protein